MVMVAIRKRKKIKPERTNNSHILSSIHSHLRINHTPQLLRHHHQSMVITRPNLNIFATFINRVQEGVRRIRLLRCLTCTIRDLVARFEKNHSMIKDLWSTLLCPTHSTRIHTESMWIPRGMAQT